MSSDEAPVKPGAYKRTRLQGACDACRRKKIKCDSANMHGKTCTNCVAFGIDCTHSEPAKKRGPKSAYVEQLEQRAKNMEEMLLKFNVRPEDLDDNQHSVQQTTASFASTSSPATNYNGIPSSISSNPGYPSLASDAPASDNKKQDPEDEEEDFAHVALADHLSKMSLSSTVERRFFGPSSAFMIMKNAHKVKEQTVGHDTHPFKRMQYWGQQAWEKEFSERERPLYIYPETDLMISLIGLFFSEVNIYLPVLHGPSFKRCVAQGLHFHDPNFGGTLLLVCAVASRYSNDPRVFADPTSELSCGWAYFEQVQTMRKSIMEPPTLYELQFYCLSTIYMLGTSSPSSSWTLVAVGIRFAEEMGVHRRQPEGHKWTSIDEQKRRAFWVLVSLDRLISSFVGRPSAIRDEDFDVEYPLECDDEYWEDPDPERSFKQPPDKPALIACFNSHLRLCEILAFALRTLYSTKKSKLLLGLVGEEWEQKIIRELDTALREWFSSVPEHLRWNPMRQNNVFAAQSAFLFTMYYNTQIQSHRAFLQKASHLSFQSLAICTNAARTTIQVLDTHFQRGGIIGLPQILYSAFISAMVIMLNLWGSKRAGIRVDHERELASAHKIMRILRACDQRWNIAGRFWDMLSELARDFESPYQYQPSTKRARNANDPINLPPPPMPQQQQHSQQPSPAQQQQSHNTYGASEQYPARSQYNQQAPEARLASQLMYGWRMAPDNPSAWNDQQTMDSLSTIDKTTAAYLEQIFGKIDGLSYDMGATYASDVGQEAYPVANQTYIPDTSQLQPGYDGAALNMTGAAGSESYWESAPSGFDFDTWGAYVESMGLSNMAAGTSYHQS